MPAAGKVAEQGGNASRSLPNHWQQDAAALKSCLPADIIRPGKNCKREVPLIFMELLPLHLLLILIIQVLTLQVAAHKRHQISRQKDHEAVLCTPRERDSSRDNYLPVPIAIATQSRLPGILPALHQSLVRLGLYKVEGH